MRGDIHSIKGAKGRRGHEQGGGRFAVIIQSDDVLRSTVIVAPTSTSSAPGLIRPEVVLVGETTRVMVEQMMAVDWSRLGDPVAHLTHKDLHAVDVALRNVLSIE